jgi:isopenicillin-N N-acyltransferase-like protein
MLRRPLAWLVTLALIAAPPVLAEPQPLAAPAARPTATATAGVPIIHLSGDAEALGASHGRQLGAIIRPAFAKYFGEYFEGETRRRQAAQAVRAFEQFIRPEHLVEIRALAQASNITEGEALLAQAFLDLAAPGACSTLALSASAAPDGVPRMARNLDFFSFDVADRHSTLLIFHPKDAFAFASVSWLGIVGVLSGMNEHGLCVANMEVPRGPRPPTAMPNLLLYRTLLERCRTVDDAIRLLRETPRQTANSLMLIDTSGDRAVAEIRPDGVTVRRAGEDEPLVSTNHHRGEDVGTPGHCSRFDHLYKGAKASFGASVSRTLQTMIFEPSTRTLHLLAGPDARRTGPEGDRTFARIELAPLFKHSEAD